MREPKTPLPWGGSQGDDRKVGSVDDFARITSVVAAFKDRQDAAYAVHAANALPEVLAALRELIDEHLSALRSRNAYWGVKDIAPEDDLVIVQARAALAKADAP